MESHVSINVARTNKHFFRVNITDGSPVSWEDVYRTLRSRFQPPLYQLDITRWDVSGTQIKPPTNA